jgi:hypothetical protein
MRFPAHAPAPMVRWRGNAIVAVRRSVRVEKIVTLDLATVAAKECPSGETEKSGAASSLCARSAGAVSANGLPNR